MTGGSRRKLLSISAFAPVYSGPTESATNKPPTSTPTHLTPLRRRRLIPTAEHSSRVPLRIHSTDLWNVAGQEARRQGVCPVDYFRMRQSGEVHTPAA